ncbi:MAG: carbohydrate binding family 9 domain-containing protein [Gemmatimonadota bacterium]|nr:carbohydrate binding family 9 domain-containing protein [Gemmatimonadota bacterium]MDH3479785.1 carbohydrate binding family 9 domain-containing protein [Gemmatimonadota bacterium]MDH5549268.1 carbohydrate binding family 9 domain-containing protein [Gemmatimonadota bacterium]
MPAGVGRSVARLVPSLMVLFTVAGPVVATVQGQSKPNASADSVVGDSLVTPTAGTPEHDRLAPRTRVMLLQDEIRLDGRLDESIWQTAPAVTAFTQREPNEGEPATQRTEIRFVYNDAKLYVGARMYDELGAEGVVSRLVRRDAHTQSDQLTVTFDTFHDHTGQTTFSINPAGVRGDAFGHDDSWDPVWRARAQVDSLGWTAELEIPFSQLRFPRNSDQEWGLQIQRFVQRLNEVAVWSFWRLNESGGPSRFGHLDGLSQIQARTNRLEVLPYAVSQLDVNGGTVDAANPFAGKTQSAYRIGADLKYLLTSNLTLSATINPDFGQAEVDPAVVNLSAFETFFPEKREFFIEGRGNFGFGDFWCQFCSNVSSLSMSFTRRIGRQPQGGFLAGDAGAFSDVPTASTILGAAKITGKTGAGTSVGILGALTQREKARVAGTTGERFEQEVEPLTSYVMGRVKQDLFDGNLQIGAIGTSVYRNFDDPALEEFLTAHAEGFGVDGEYWWGDRTYHVLFSSAFTNISGSTDAILRAQQASSRYFQRPDRQHGSNGLFSDRLDSTLTSMRGWGLYSRIAKDAGDWGWETSLNVRSPGFENNDIAFLTRTDFIWMNANLTRSWTVPGTWYRQIFTTLGAQQQYNFDGDLTDRQFHGYFGFQAPFYWNFDAFGIHRPSTLDDRLTRGGPVVKRPGFSFVAAFAATDSRKPVIVGFNPSLGWDADGGRVYELGFDVTFKPASNVSLTLSPSFSQSKNPDQYVTAVDDPTADAFFGRRYVFAELNQKSLSITTRLNVTFTPTMTLELFMQPLISANDFSNFKEFDEPRQLAKSVYGVDLGTIREEGEGSAYNLFIDPDGSGPAEEFSVANQDFNFRSLRANLVFRWEYTPGSTLFLVWTHDRNATDPFGNLDLSRDLDALKGAVSDNIFLVKLTYWLGM